MTRFFSLITAGVFATALASVAMAQPIGPKSTPPPVPDNLQVPAGNTLFLAGEAKGTQNYVCMPTAAGFAWTFFSPQATVFLTYKVFGSDVQQQILTHFLSPNAAEKGTPRVTWQSSHDTSAVWGKSMASSTDPKFVADGAIPWVLLQEVGTRQGPAGGNIMAQTTFVQRLNTAGGVSPATGCSVPENVGATALVPYSADYFFFKATPQN
jgi:hypothetical protein